jgi:thiamine biosynthesis lipoprotein
MCGAPSQAKAGVTVFGYTTKLSAQSSVHPMTLTESPRASRPCFILGICSCTLLFWLLVGCQSVAHNPPAITRIQPHLGTLISITVHDNSNNATVQRAINAAFDEFRAVDKLLSIHRANSELSVLNKAAAKGPVVASAELFAALQTAQAFSRQTEGAFDPTIRPLADLWGFIKKEGYRLPTTTELATVLPRVGWQKVRLDNTRRTVHFTAPGVSIDPGGFGKGLAVDRAIARLKALGINNAMVKAGGDLRLIGLPPGHDHWRIFIEDPKKKGRRAAIRLRGGALSTSGNYENFFMANGRRYSHLLDPRTGLPVQEVASCTVTAPTCVQSDALATACFILGPKKSMALFGNKLGIRFILEKNGKLVPVSTPGFTSLP